MKSIRRLKSKRWSVFLTIISFAFLCCFIPDKPAKAETNIGGIINTDTIWTLASSPYIIADTLQVSDGVTLRIREGVEVRIAADKSIKVAGALIADGTNSNPVVFTSISVDKWQGIEFINSNGSQLNNSILENAERAVDLKGVSVVPMVGNIFRNNGWVISDSDGYQRMYFVNNTASDNSEVFYGIKTIGSDNIFRNNIFRNNSSVFSFGYYFGSTTVDNNDFINNTFVIKAPEQGYGYGTVSLVNNWWDTIDVSIIDRLVEDEKDNVELQSLDYTPIITSEISNVGSSIVLKKVMPQDAICTSWAYSDWSSCSSNGQQTRTIVSTSLSNCVGGNPVLTKSCTYVAPVCSSWTYSDWSVCTEEIQTRNVLSSMPAGCAGGNSVLTKSCNAAPTSPNPDPITTTATDGALNADIKDGDIIQCIYSADPFAVYIVKEVKGKKYIRHIVNLNIFNHYKHLQWGNLKQIDSLTGFSLSGWVRANTGPNGTAGASDKVYEINGDQTKHWINMTAQQFLAHGGSEEAIYSINQGESDLYTTGANVSSL